MHDKLEDFLKKFELVYSENSLISKLLREIMVTDHHKRPDFVEIRNRYPNWYQLKVAIELGQSESQTLETQFNFENIPENKSENWEQEKVTEIHLNDFQKVIPPVNIEHAIRNNPVDLPVTDAFYRNIRPKIANANEFDFSSVIFVPENKNPITLNLTSYKDTNENTSTHNFDQTILKNNHDENEFYRISDNKNEYQHFIKRAKNEIFQIDNFDSFKQEKGVSENIYKNKIHSITENEHRNVQKNLISNFTNEFSNFQPENIPQISENDFSYINNTQIVNYLNTNTPNIFQTQIYTENDLKNNGNHQFEEYLLSKIGQKTVEKHDEIPLNQYSKEFSMTIAENKDLLVTSPLETPDFHKKNQFFPNSENLLNKKPKNDFKSGLSELGHPNFLKENPEETKITLSSYLKKMKN